MKVEALSNQHSWPARGYELLPFFHELSLAVCSLDSSQNNIRFSNRRLSGVRRLGSYLLSPLRPDISGTLCGEVIAPFPALPRPKIWRRHPRPGSFTLPEVAELLALRSLALSFVVLSFSSQTVATRRYYLLSPPVQIVIQSAKELGQPPSPLPL